MKVTAIIKRDLRSLAGVEKKRLSLLKKDLSLILNSGEEELKMVKKAVAETIEDIESLSSSYKEELRGIYNSFIFLALNLSSGEKNELLKLVDKFNIYKNFRDFIRRSKKLPPYEAYKAVIDGKVKKGGVKPPKSKNIKIKLNPFSSDVTSLEEELKEIILSLLKEGNEEKLKKAVEFLKSL